MGDQRRGGKVGKAVMVPLIVSHDGAVHKDTVRRWKDFASHIQVDWMRIAQSVLRYNFVIVGKFFNKGSWVSEAWRKEHPETLGRSATAVERMAVLNLEPDPESTMCAVFWHATSTRCSADVRWKGTPQFTEGADQSTYFLEVEFD